MDNYDLEKEIEEHNRHYGKDCGEVFEEKHNNTKFLIKPALKYVIDDIDPLTGDIELSHHEKKGYNKVTNYTLLDDTDTLDLTWMKTEDVIDLDENPQHKDIKKIDVNVANLRNCDFPTSSDMFKNAEFIVHSNFELNIIEQASRFGSFLHDYQQKGLIKDVQLDGFSRYTEIILKRYAKKYDVKLVSSHKGNEKSK